MVRAVQLTKKKFSGNLSLYKVLQHNRTIFSLESQQHTIHLLIVVTFCSIYSLPNQALLMQSAILIMKIDFLKVLIRQTFKKTILVFPAPKALETPKSIIGIAVMLYKVSLQEFLVAYEPL
jgi:hypothetical protein